VVGAASGVGLVRALLGLYAQYFRFDRLVPDVAASDVLASLGGAAGAGLLGAWASVRTATAIPPAEAMQPPVPPSYGHGLTRLPERVRGLSPGARMVWRTLLRRPGRTLLSVLGIALAGALLALSGIAWEGLNWVLERSFQDAAREDVSVTFADPLGRAALDELAGWPGVVRVEGERAVPVRLVGPGGRWDGSVTAREQGARLRRSLGRGGEELAPPAGDGLLLTDALARRLGLAAGGTAWVERRDGDRRAQAVRVSGLSTEVVGLAAQASPGTVRALFGGELYTGAYLRVEAGQEAAVLSRLARVPRVAGASLRRAGLSSFRRLMADSMDVTRAVLWLFASVLAAGVVYNDGRVALAEQARELATLRVLGFARAECARLFLGGLAVRVVASLAPGWALGWGFARLLMAQLSNSELFRLPLVTHPSTWVNGTGVVLLASAVTGAWLARAVWRLDLVAVLKARE
jgi:putative ABC transport system permease protein